MDPHQLQQVLTKHPPSVPATAAPVNNVANAGAATASCASPANPLAFLQLLSHGNAPTQPQQVQGPPNVAANQPKNAYANEELAKGARPLTIPGVNGQDPQHGNQQTGGIDWTDGADPDMTKARAGAEDCGYNIQSVVDPKTGKIVITSNNNRMEVNPMSAQFDKMFEGKNQQEIQKMIDDWQAKKNADDKLAYSNVNAANGGKVQGTEDLRQLAQQNGYYNSEQHMVWAFAASARTGGRVPPEFFMDFDPFGGTAGNGPEIQPGGNSGEPLSTISMAHDTDWSLGRYMDVGPLKALHDINPTEQYQMKRMGMAGLFNGTEALAIERARMVNPFDPKDVQRGQTDDQIFRALNGASGTDVLYRGWSPNILGDENYKLNSNLSDWDVQYRPSYARNVAGPTDDKTEFSADQFFYGDGVHGDAIGDLNKQYSPGGQR